jgi:predicted O-methyltransferase YrrM
MNIKSSLKDYLLKVSSLSELLVKDRQNMEIVLASALQKANGKKEILFPINYLEFLRDCIKKEKINYREIKTDSASSNDIFNSRFSCLLDILNDRPPVEFEIAEEIGKVADTYRGNYEIRTHFEISSSFGKKGRILMAIVRILQTKKCLELGTAYGMASLFILEALKANEPCHLSTIEGWKDLFFLSSQMLDTRYGNRVTCELGLTQDVLPRIVNSIQPLDLLFHDAGHSKEDYVRDFNMVLPILKPGSIAIIDDIRWKGDPSTYEGWKEVLNHPRVRRAVEIDNGGMGLLLIGE